MRHPAFDIVAGCGLSDHVGQGLRFRHRMTGADVVAVLNDDPEKVVSVTFPTLPEDDTGVAHVLEHMVFRGSRRFPLSRPFSALLQSSLQTYLNASTGPDRTTYHAASLNDADLGNLAAVIMDAVLHPLLCDEHFAQEAWHLGGEGGSQLSGVVLTEMRGHWTDPVNVWRDAMRRGLYPGTALAHVYGGDPVAMPTLTPDALRRFHARFYHPSSMMIFLWGAVDLAAMLDRIDGGLDGIAARSAVPETGVIPVPWTTSRDSALSYPGATGAVAGAGWVLAGPQGSLGPLGRDCMALALVGQQGAGLRGLLESGAPGQIWVGDGLTGDFAAPMFNVGMAGPDPDQMGMLGHRVDAALALLARDGVSADATAGAVSMLAFRLRAQGSGPRPRGLVALDRILGRWRHGGDPLAALDHGSALQQLTDGIARDRHALNELVRQDITENQNRLTLHVSPDTGPPPARPKGAVSTPANAPFAAVPVPAFTVDSPAALASLPLLSLADLPRRVTPSHVIAAGPVLCLTTAELGIVRADLALDMTGLAPGQVQLVPLLAAILSAAGGDVALGQAIAMRTGGISAQVWTASGRWQGAQRRPDAVRLILRGAALATQAGALCDLIQAVWDRISAITPDALRRITLQTLATAQRRPLGAGHVLAEVRLAAASGLAGAVRDMTEGPGLVARLRHLADRAATDPEGLRRELVALAVALRAVSDAVLTVTADPESFGALLPRGGPPAIALPFAPMHPREGHVVAMPLNVVGVAADLTLLGGRPPDGAGLAGLRAIATGWLWERVRVAGGAYGIRARLDMGTGLATFASFRDPHLLATVDACRAAPDWLRRNADAAMVDRCRIGAIAELMRPLPPDGAMLAALEQHLTGPDDAARQADLEAALATSVTDLRHFADDLAAGLQVGPLVVLAERAALLNALAQRPGLYRVIAPEGDGAS